MARPATGTVRWTGDHWRARVTLADGSRPWIDLPSNLGASDREKAKAKAAELAAYVREHGYQRSESGAVVGDTETLRDYLVRWVAERERRGIRSVKSDRQRITSHVLPLVGDLRMRAITPKDVRAVVAALDAKIQSGALAWRTALNTWVAFAKLLGDACGSKVEALRVLETNPAAGVAPPDRGADRSKAYLYPSELLRLLTCRSIAVRWRRVYAVAVYTYCRAGELEALTVDDVDLERGVLHVHGSADRDTGEVRETKTKQARRLPIEPALRPLLEVLVAEARARVADGGSPRLLAMPAREECAVLLRTHLRYAGIDRAELFASDALRSPITFHDLRATGITWRAVRGDEHLKIQRSAGHTTLDTTQRYIREAENLIGSFGEVFPELPKGLLTDTGKKRWTGVPSFDSSDEAESDENGEDSGASISPAPTGLENVEGGTSVQSISGNSGGVVRGTRSVERVSDGFVTARDDCETTDRTALAAALRAALQAGRASGDGLLCDIAKQALARLEVGE